MPLVPVPLVQARGSSSVLTRVFCDPPSDTATRFVRLPFVRMPRPPCGLCNSVHAVLPKSHFRVRFFSISLHSLPRQRSSVGDSRDRSYRPLMSFCNAISGVTDRTLEARRRPPVFGNLLAPVPYYPCLPSNLPSVPSVLLETIANLRLIPSPSCHDVRYHCLCIRSAFRTSKRTVTIGIRALTCPKDGTVCYATSFCGSQASYAQNTKKDFVHLSP